MNQVGIFLSIFAIFIVALDVVVRLVIAPNRRDRFLEDLLDTMTEPEAAEQIERVTQPSFELNESMVESVIRYFELSATSRHILAALAVHAEGLTELEVISAVNDQLARRRRRDLPAAVVRRVVSLLMRAELATLRQGKLEITKAGRHLHTLLEVRSAGKSPALAFASR